MKSDSVRQAEETFRNAFHVAPSIASRSPIFGGLRICGWKTPWMDNCELAENDDLVVICHRGGARRVQTIEEGGWSSRRSAPGLLTLIPPGTRTAYRIDGQVAFDSIHIPGSSLVEFVGSQDSRLAQVSLSRRFAFRDGFVAACVDALVDNAYSLHPTNRQFVQSVVQALLRRLILLETGSPDSIHGAEPAERSRISVSRIKAVIEERITTGVSIEGLASEFGVSRSHFTLLFRAEVGVSPHRYLNLRRIERAKSLLHHSSMSLVDVAQELGFCSQAHFTDVFRAITGSTPLKYRQRV
jgi:AraC family transcriptional regulator